MTTVSVAGDPERIKAYIDNLISLGNKIYQLSKAKTVAYYIIVYGV